MPIDKPIDLDQTSRLSKWTGHEASYGTDKKLWFVFNQRSLLNSWSGWYPVRCNLGALPKERSEERSEGVGSSTPAHLSDKPSPAASLNQIIESPEFQWASVSLTGSTLSSVTFAKAQEEIQRMMSRGPEVIIGDVDESEVNQELHRLLGRDL